MTDNEKAAVAGGLWTDRRGKAWLVDNQWHVEPDPAPDMHLPENLWRALENRRFNVLVDADLYAKRPLAETVLAALVALYDAEHPHGRSV